MIYVMRGFAISMMLAGILLMNLDLLMSGAQAQDSGAQKGTVSFQAETVAEGLRYPWGLGFLPGGDILVTERGHGVRVIRNGTLLPEVVTNIPEAYVDGQGGYFDILPHPDYETNKLVYLSFAHGTLEKNSTRIIRAKFDGDALRDVEVIFDTAPEKDTPVHYGGRMAFLPDGTLLMTTGDGFDYREQAQRKSNSLGKTIRINDDGTIPADNPFRGAAGQEPTIWTLGHRSPQGLAIDPETGTVYQHEHGPRGGDEVNILKAGQNYGWPIATYGQDYSGATISPFTEYKDTVQPMTYWVPSIAPSGLTVYRGNAFPAWDGDLFVGGLVTRALHRLQIEKGKIVEETKLLQTLKARIRDVRTGPDGYLYITTDSSSGKVIRLVP